MKDEHQEMQQVEHLDARPQPNQELHRSTPNQDGTEAESSHERTQNEAHPEQAESTGPDQQTEARRSPSDKRARILTSSLNLFTRYGYDATTIRMISSDAGISLGLMYNYFKGKHEVLKEIYAQYADELTRAFSIDDKEPDPAKRFAGLVQRMFQSVNGNLNFYKLLYAVRMQPSVQKLLVPEFVSLNNTVRSNLERLLRDLGYREPEVEARLLFALLDGASNHYVLYHGQMPIDQMAELIIRRYTGGLIAGRT